METVTDYEKIKELRKEHGLTQADLSKASGITLSTIKSIETGRVQLSPENAEKLSGVFNMPAKDFYVRKKKDTVVIAGAIHKGGAGKSSITTNLAYNLSQMGYKVLGIDTDAQMNFTHALGLGKNSKNFYLAYVREEDIRNHIIETHHENLDVVVGDVHLASIESEHIPFREFRTRRILENAIKEGIYDYIIIDTNPTLGAFNTSILNAVDEVLIPVEPSSFGIEGLAVFLDHFNSIKKYNANLKMLGVVFNKVDARKSISQVAYETVKEAFGPIILETIIRSDAHVEKSQWAGEPISLYSPQSRAAQDLKALTKEVVRILNERKK